VCFAAFDPQIGGQEAANDAALRGCYPSLAGMKVSIEHVFAIAPSDYATLYFDEPFAIAVNDAVGLERRLLRLDRDAERVVRHIRSAPRDIPSVFAKLIDGRAFEYFEEIEVDLRTLRGRWRIVPNVFAERVRASGTLDFEDAGGQVRRVVRGEVKIAVPAIGGVVERFVAAEVARSYEVASSFTRTYLERRLNDPSS
jgi:hypothetical protein